MNEFYPEIEPYNHFLLAVDHPHQLYVEECGNPEGQAVLFIHGGPGSGCSSKDRRFFDPQEYRIILFDQRGCGRSLPHGCLEDNETASLVSDIEKIREKLGIVDWHVFGGSWGSTLALVYAQAHADRVRSLVLRGIFLARPEDCEWTFSGGGASRIFPEYWGEYLSALPKLQDQTPVQAAHAMMTGEDKSAALKVAKAWSTWEMRCCTLVPDPDFVNAATTDESCWTLARHEAHYMLHNCFLAPNHILENCGKIQDIPTVIVHGRYDIVCPFDNAWLLHQRLPGSELVVSEAAGHSSSEQETKLNLISATKKMLAVTSATDRV
jgi:proline iminopeptidase